MLQLGLTSARAGILPIRAGTPAMQAPSVLTFRSGQVADPAYVRSLPGITEPFGFFDPLSFCEGASQGRIKFFREVEIKHGRVAMLATVGYLVGEGFHPMWGGNINVPSFLAFQETPLQTALPAVAALIGVHEVLSVFTFNSPIGGELFSIRSDYRSGDLGWDPLGLRPSDPLEYKDMQSKEINNGRLAMIAIVGMIGQEMAHFDKIIK